ncbi:MAG: head GIN domain-containing protein [bacterium]|nr:DUF2807 domain-containing protein [Gammaproteobacteria bacterium]HIL96859.1 DUF2807 domain-containing protein [Pseudomonadales bacterium]
MTVETRSVMKFDQVRFRGPGTLKIIQSDDESLTIHAPDYVLKNIQSEVVDGVLRLGYVNPHIVLLKVRREIISYDLKMKDVRRVTFSGTGRIVIPDLDNDHVSVLVSGSGQLSLEKLTADQFEANITGSGSVKAEGDVEVQRIKISGSGQYSSEKLVSDFADINVAGAGSVSVSVSDELSVVISGSGSVSYAGYPDVYKQITGSGKVTRRRKEPQPPKRGKEHAW